MPPQPGLAQPQLSLPGVGSVAAFPEHSLNAPIHEAALEQEQDPGVKPRLLGQRV